MPVTVKFSEAFYGKFGHEAVDELVNFLNRIDSSYRSELTELNEHSFARFDDRLGRRVAEIEAKIDHRAAELKAEFGHGIDQLRTEIAAARADTIKWMFVFVATAVLAILGLG